MRNFKRDGKTSGNSDFFLYETMHCTNPTGLPPKESFKSFSYIEGHFEVSTNQSC